MQETLEQAIAAVTQEEVRLVAAGRTDAGAHAHGQLIAFTTSSRLPTSTLLLAVNAHLPHDVAVVDVAEVPAAFDPRRDASSRVYRYLIWNRRVRSPFWHDRAAHVPPRLDEEAMHQAATCLQGTHDFTAFVAADAPGPRTRHVHQVSCWREGDLVLIELEATGFMKQMARSIAGTLIEVGLGKLPVEAVRDILASADRTRAGRTAPAHGLYLRSVLFAPAARRRAPDAGPAEENA